MAMRGEVVKLDRGFPLIRLEDGTQLRAEHAVSLVKGGGERAVVGDEVMVDVPEEHDKAIIVEILPRWRTFTRKDHYRAGAAPSAGRQLRSGDCGPAHKRCEFAPA